VHVLPAVGDVDVPVNELVVPLGGVEGYAHARRDHVDDGLPVQDDVSTVHGRPHFGAGAYRPVVEDLAVVGDRHLMGEEVHGRDVAVADDEGGGNGALPPFAPADVPAVEVARNLHLLADGPVGGGTKVQLHGAEPVPTAGHRLAHGDVQAGKYGLLGGIGAHGLREGENDGLAHADGNARAREDTGCDGLWRGGSRETFPTLRPQPGTVAHHVADCVRGPGPERARRPPLLGGGVEPAPQHGGVRTRRDVHVCQPSGAGKKCHHGAELLACGPVRRRNDYLRQQVVDGHLVRRGTGRTGRGLGRTGGVLDDGTSPVRARMRRRREAADDRHRQEGAHDSDPAHKYGGPARAETFLAARTPPDLSGHT
jgi:hypothetical protein